MTAERIIRPFDLLRIHLTSIREDLGRANQMRWEPEQQKKETIESLKIITNPHFILASPDGKYITGNIVTSSHAILMKELRENTLRNGLVHPSNFVSGIGFSLKDHPSTKYVRIDVMSYDWEELPEYAKTLIEAGYTVVDTQFKRVDKDVNYSLWWTERNDS